ncbi:hypothetical protein FOB64_006479 [Candida albicans]|uniref:Uncharacterized protein n=1 Tax=Candida albicans TaxID=5476 RepID=A0A8H6BRI8_CANAX|nr:hypothetical protein FOB64_006479 [Candida albicans]
MGKLRGSLVGIRANLQHQDIGPPDLIHRSIYAGSKSALYNQNDFVKDKQKKDDDGYVGYYHFVNGLKPQSSEQYIMELIKHGAPYKRDAIITYCTYNIFSKTDFRMKYTSEIHPNYLKELDASQIVRFIYYLDNPDNQLVGLVNFPDYVKDKEAILGSLDILTKHLPKGYMTGTSSGYGAPTSCGDDKKTNYYRNRLVDAIIRLD